MTHLISILVASLLFFGFLLLTMYEARRGVRFFPTLRYRLDARVARANFLIDHIDWGAFTAHLTRTSLHTVAHDAAHATLLAVRAVERFLTRTVGALRIRRDRISLPEAHTSRVTSSVATLAENFRRPRETRPMNDIVRRGEGE